jgi:tetratricopeptide (TPR) repeat protein
MTTAPGASTPAAAAAAAAASSSSSNHHRKMRRSREAAAPSDNDSSVLSGFDLYSLQGDAAGAHGLFAAAAELEESDSGTGGGRSGRGSGNAAGGSKSPSFVRRYNQLILSSLVAASSSAASASESQPPRLDDDNGLVNEMMRMDDEFRSRISGSSKNSSISPRKKRRNELIMAFNRALLAFATGRREEAEGTCEDVLRELVPPTGNGKPPDEYAMVSSRIAFLWLECQLARSVGGATTMPWSGENLSTLQVTTMESVVNWLEAFDSERDPQLKFLLNLYRSRIDLAALDGAGRHDDARIRSARKELKQAMDVFQHRLRPTYGADSAGSVVSSANSEENTHNSASGTGTAAPANANATPVESQQPAPGSVVLQRHNQSALSLKANSEQLKGNTKKSLILCGEAHAAVATSNSAAADGAGGGGGGDDASYEVLHENNLAIIYETIGKRHLALHALTKALRASASASAGGPPPAFFPDGTARPDPTLMVLHNAAICALQARNYRMAYRCMAACVARSDVFHGNPRCWLRLAEACVGIFADDRHRRKTQGQGQPLFTPVQVGGYVDHC